MTDHHATPTLRESVDELGARLARIGAATSTLRNLAPQIRHGIPPSTLLTTTEALERDLALASHQVEVVHDRARLELSSLVDSPRLDDRRG
jgi:hypothetical protein